MRTRETDEKAETEESSSSSITRASITLVAFRSTRSVARFLFLLPPARGAPARFSSTKRFNLVFLIHAPRRSNPGGGLPPPRAPPAPPPPPENIPPAPPPPPPPARAARPAAPPG